MCFYFIDNNLLLLESFSKNKLKKNLTHKNQFLKNISVHKNYIVFDCNRMIIIVLTDNSKI